MDRRCSVDGCASRVLARGWCAKHYNRMRAKGSTDDRRKNARGTCTIEGCDRLQAAFGRCDYHYRAEYKKRPPVLHGLRLCAFCDQPIAESRNSRAIFCSVACKNKERVRSGAASAATRRHYYRSQYGLTQADLDAMLAEQGGVCAICGTAKWNGHHDRPFVDHCHRTGKVRGLLCSECNNGIGKLKDDPAILEAALAYLRR